ncbi:hypothetical protein CPB83DRAFT_856276 [Crepidotus variabilis]|uniref:Protein-S-isoprenylcysteine O-methyltransferase n=1 Tax=Crepidotus variabilis TaxID=179855 RepID=A0A9P6EDU0_9AGAR|nr:hypothetical protein CPB83DRAFT_856276 [Crepidotus variabilis]
MVTHPFIHISCILAAIVGFDVTMTPPAPPPSPEDSVNQTTRLEKTLLSSRLICKGIAWSFAVAEASVLLASQFPKAQISSFVLSMLVTRSSPADIRTTKWFLLGTVLAASGGYIRVLCYRTLGPRFTFERTIARDHKLGTTGPYSWVRHPGYASAIMVFSGTIVWNAAPGSYARECGPLDTVLGRACAAFFLPVMTSVMIVMLGRTWKEDKTLEKIFGQEWRDWADKVPYRLVPWII